MKKALISLMIFFLAVGCQKDEKATIKDGWKAFSKKDYEKALDIFLDFIEKDNNMEAYPGAGWCYLRMGDLTQAQSYFSSNAGHLYSRAGLAFVFWAGNAPNSAIENAGLVLQQQANFVFDKDPRIDYKDLIWIQAACYYQLENYQQCVNKIQLLDTGFTVDINNPDIVNILMAKIEDLGAVIN